MSEIKRSRKSKIKKRSEEWDNLKVELAKELGLWPKVKDQGWAGLSAEESGRLGGVFAARKNAAKKNSNVDINEILDVEIGMNCHHKCSEKSAGKDS